MALSSDAAGEFGIQNREEHVKGETMSTLLLALAFQVWFPIFQDTVLESTGVTLINSSSDSAEFTIRMLSPDGQETRQFTLTVPRTGERFVGLDELLGGPSGTLSGSVRVESSTSDFSAYLTTSGVTSVSATEPVSRLSSTVMLHHALVDKGFRELAETDTQVALVNPGSQPARVVVTAIGTNGTIRGELPISLPASGSRVVRVSQFVQSPFDGNVMVRGSSPMAAWQQVETPLSRGIIAGRDAAAFHLSTNLIVPFFVVGGNYASTISLTNTAQSPVTLEISGNDKDGLVLGETATVKLEAGQTTTSDIASLLRMVTVASVPGPVITGSLRIRQPQKSFSYLLASVKVEGFDQQFAKQSSMLYWVQETPSQFWEIPFATKSELYFTALAIANPSERSGATAEVLVVVYARDGRITEVISESIPPLGSHTLMLAPPEPGAYLRILSSDPIAVLGTFGTRDGRSIETIAGRRLPK